MQLNIEQQQQQQCLQSEDSNSLVRHIGIIWTAKKAEHERQHLSPQEHGWQQWHQTHMDHPQRI